MEKNYPAISVIVAMYNAEKYISECLTSLTAQTFQNFEVIVVDDCSTDSSCALVENFSATFGDRLKLAKLAKNSGCASIPRNFALQAARGKYVYFLDSDDLLTATALEEFYTVAEKFGADVVHAEKCLAFFDEDGKSSAEVISNQAGNFVTEPTLETFDIGARVTAFTQKKFLWQVWGKLYCRKLIVDNKITFPALKSFEDFVFVFKCLTAAKNYVRVPFVSYYYRIRKNSLSHETADGVEISLTAIEVVKALDKFMGGQKFFRDNPQHRYAILDFFIQERLEVIAKNFFVTSNLSPAEVFDFFREKIFSSKPEENVALTSYLFVADNIFKLYTTYKN